MKHKHLTLQDRYYIEISIKNGGSQTTIAKALNRSQGTISKEIKRNTGKRGYRHKQADRLAIQRHQDKPKSIKLTNEIIEFIEDKLADMILSDEIGEGDNLIVSVEGDSIVITK